MKKHHAPTIAIIMASLTACSNMKEVSNTNTSINPAVHNECKSTDGQCAQTTNSPFVSPGNNIPGGAIRQELFNLTTEKKVDYTIIGTSNASSCGWSALPIFPILPSHIIEYSPALIHVNGSAEAAYISAIKKAGADFLIDTKVSKKSTNLFLASYTCYHVTGLAAKITK